MLAQIILDFQNKELPELIERDMQINFNTGIKRAFVIMGPRRSGKTYYLYLLIKKLILSGINKQRILYINFEDPKLVSMALEDLMKLIEIFYEIYPDNRKQEVWLFFDEIQNIGKGKIFVRNLLDSINAKISSFVEMVITELKK